MAKRAFERRDHCTTTSEGRVSAGNPANSLFPPPTKRSKLLLEPVSVWKTFPRLKFAIEYSITCNQDVAIFSYESSGLSTSGGGVRRFLVTTYYEFGKRYLLMKSPRHFYEVITEGTVCHLYFDLEYNIKLNPTTNPLKILQVFKQYVSCQLKHVFNLTCDLEHILDLDSTTADKFSRHLIYHLEGSAFRNNLVVGNFVRYICDRLRSLKDSATIKYKDVIHLNRLGHACTCPPAADLLELFIKTPKGTGLICDEAVYTRNRNFRLLLSTKKGKDAKLRIAKESVFKSSHGVDTRRKKWSMLYNNLMDSLICNVRFETTSIILDSPFHHEMVKHMKSSNPPSSSVTNNVSSYDRGMAGTGSAGAGGSPYPMLDEFITSKLVKDGLTGRIRESTFFSQGKLIVYEITGYRWCQNIGRHHKSNNIMIIVDLKDSSYYQKCHDLDCKRIDFRSNKYPIPPDVIGLCSDDNELTSGVMDEGDWSEMRRIMVSDFTGNDSFNDSKLLTNEDGEGQTISHGNDGSQSVKGEICELDDSIGHDLVKDLSYDEVFGPESPPLSSQNSLASVLHNDATTLTTKTGKNTKFCEGRSQQNITDSPSTDRQSMTTTGSHSMPCLTSTPIKRKPSSKRVKPSLDLHVTCRRQLVKTEPVEFSNESLSQLEMDSFLEGDNDLPDMGNSETGNGLLNLAQMKIDSFNGEKPNNPYHKPVKNEPINDEIEDNELLNLSQNEMESFLDKDNEDCDQQLLHNNLNEQPLRDDLLNLSQQETSSFFQDDYDDDHEVKMDEQLNLSQQETSSFFQDDYDDDHEVKMGEQLNLSQQEMNSFLHDINDAGELVEDVPLDIKDNLLNLSHQELGSFLQDDEEIVTEGSQSCLPLLSLSQQEMNSFLQDNEDDDPLGTTDDEPLKELLNLSQHEMNSFFDNDDG